MKKFAQSHSFLFGIPSFFLSAYADNYNELVSCSSLLAFNCQLALQQCFGAALCKKNIFKTTLILFSLPLALIKALTVSLCPNDAHFLLCLFFGGLLGVVFIFFWEGGVMVLFLFLQREQ